MNTCNYYGNDVKGIDVNILLLEFTNGSINLIWTADVYITFGILEAICYY